MAIDVTSTTRVVLPLTQPAINEHIEAADAVAAAENVARAARAAHIRKIREAQQKTEADKAAAVWAAGAEQREIDRQAHVEAMRKTMPFGLTPEEAVEFDRLNDADRKRLFNLAPDSPAFDDIIETRTDTDIIAESNKPAVPLETQLRNVFHKAFTQEKLNLADTEPQRIAVAWRLVRELARIKGQVNTDQTLQDGLTGDARNPDPWMIPDEYAEHRTHSIPPPSPALLRILFDSQQLAEEHQYARYDDRSEKMTYHAGIAVLPPPVPASAMEISDSGYRVLPTYDPADDKLLGFFVAAMRSISKSLFIQEGSPADRDYGVMGLAGLLRMETCRLAFPSKTQICTYEALMIQKTSNWLIHNSINECRAALRQEFGLQQHEITQLVRMARAYCKSLTEGDIEEDRSLMLLRLEDYLKRSKSALDLNSEMKALKQMSIILGLAKLDTDDEMSEFLEVVRSVNHERKQPRLEVNAAPKRLQG